MSVSAVKLNSLGGERGGHMKDAYCCQLAYLGLGCPVNGLSA